MQKAKYLSSNDQMLIFEIILTIKYFDKLADVNHYRVNEMQAADRTLEQIVQFYIKKAQRNNDIDTTKTLQPSVNIIGSFNLAFHNQHDIAELKRLMSDLNIQINTIIPITIIYTLQNIKLT